MRKSLSVFLIALLAVVMAVPALAVDVELPLVSEPTTFTIMVKKEDMSQNTWPEKAPVQFTEEQTGIHIEWIEVPSSGWNEKLNLTFASGDLPDAIIGGVDVVSNTDVLAPLDEIIDACAPNIQQMFADLPDLRGALTLSDGHIYSLPNGDADVKNEINSELWINKAWLEKLGLEMPKTVDEFYDVLVAFRDGDPNGNGMKDEIPLLVSATTDAPKIDNLFGFFGTTDNDYHARVQEGKVIFTPAESTYFEGLQFLHKLYAEGLMNQEYYTEDISQYLAKGNMDPCIVGVTLEWYIDNIILASYVPDFTYLPPLEGKYGPMLWGHYFKANSPQGNLNGVVITTACENPELLVRWYDYCNSSLDIVNLWNYGPENLIWRYLEDGRWEVFTDNVPEGSSSSQIRRTMGCGPNGPIYAYSRWRGPQAEKYAARIAAKVEANQAYKPFIAPERISNGFGSAEEEAERNMLLLDIDNYLNQFKANAVVNGITEADWEKHLQVLESLNVEEYIGYWQSFYDAHK